MHWCSESNCRGASVEVYSGVSSRSISSPRACIINIFHMKWKTIDLLFGKKETTNYTLKTVNSKSCYELSTYMELKTQNSRYMYTALFPKINLLPGAGGGMVLPYIS